jgi:hypothetical protein
LHKTPEVAAGSNPRLPVLDLMVGSLHAQPQYIAAQQPQSPASRYGPTNAPPLPRKLGGPVVNHLKVVLSPELLDPLIGLVYATVAGL